MNEHTSGPWEWWTSNSWRRLRHSVRGTSADVLMPTVHRDGQPDINVSPQDMALIAAAPDLLVALKTLLRQFENCARSHGNDNDVIALATEPARAAVAKAEGWW